MGGAALVDGKWIDEFDNFFICEFIVDGVIFCSSEQYYQYQKSNDPEYHKKLFSTTNQGQIYRIGRFCNLPSNWEDIKYDAMYKANYNKFSQNINLKKMLLETKGSIRFQHSSPQWNEWNGKILEDLRITLVG